VSKTKQAEEIILRLINRRHRPVNLSADIKPLFKGRDLPITFAIWNLVRRGDIKRIGRGSGLYKKA
jgi:hypothetical protein